jgi:putative membrane protein
MSKIDRQREHQANERTFLAWLRTSIGLIGFGFALSRFGLFLRELQITVTQQDIPTHSFISSQRLSITLVIAGITVIFMAVWRYNQVFWQIEQSNYQPKRLMVWITAGIVIVVGILSIPVLLWTKPSAPSTSSSSRSSRADHLISDRLYRTQVKNKRPRPKLDGVSRSGLAQALAGAPTPKNSRTRSR